MIGHHGLWRITALKLRCSFVVPIKYALLCSSLRLVLHPQNKMTNTNEGLNYIQMKRLQYKALHKSLYKALRNAILQANSGANA